MLELLIAKAEKSCFNCYITHLKAGKVYWRKGVKAKDSRSQTIVPFHFGIDNKLCDPHVFVDKLNDLCTNIYLGWTTEVLSIHRNNAYSVDEDSTGQAQTLKPSIPRNPSTLMTIHPGSVTYAMAICVYQSPTQWTKIWERLISPLIINQPK